MKTDHKLERPYSNCRAWIEQHVPQAVKGRALGILAGRPDLAEQLQNYFTEVNNYFAAVERNYQATVDGLFDALEAKQDVIVTVNNNHSWLYTFIVSTIVGFLCALVARLL